MLYQEKTYNDIINDILNAFGRSIITFTRYENQHIKRSETVCKLYDNYSKNITNPPIMNISNKITRIELQLIDIYKIEESNNRKDFKITEDFILFKLINKFNPDISKAELAYLNNLRCPVNYETVTTIIDFNDDKLFRQLECEVNAAKLELV